MPPQATGPVRPGTPPRERARSPSPGPARVNRLSLAWYSSLVLPARQLQAVRADRTGATPDRDLSKLKRASGHVYRLDLTLPFTDARVIAHVGTQIVADTTRALTLREATYPPVHYIPILRWTWPEEGWYAANVGGSRAHSGDMRETLWVPRMLS